MKADIRNPLRYLLITHIMSEFISLMIQASPYPLLIAPRNLAGDLLDSVKKKRTGASASVLRFFGNTGSNRQIKNALPASLTKPTCDLEIQIQNNGKHDK